MSTVTVDPALTEAPLEGDWPTTTPFWLGEVTVWGVKFPESPAACSEAWAWLSV